MISPINYLSLNLFISSNSIALKKFENCKAQNLNSIWATELLYVPGNSKEQFGNILEQNLKPIFNAAMLQGYTVWKRTTESYLN